MRRARGSKLRGDRDGHLQALTHRSWAAVVGATGCVPRSAKGAGLTFRPIGDAARDAIAWLATLPGPARAGAVVGGRAPTRRPVLAAWKART